jgi:hypothetical protein
MEVHAHTHTARKKWTHYLWEFLMLFLAVFCGFLAEYTLEHRIEKEKGMQYVRSFYEDLKTDTAGFSGLIKEYEIKIAALSKKDECFDSLPVQLKSSRPCLIDLIYNAYYFPDFMHADRTLIQLKNAGGLRLLKKDDADSILSYDRMLIGYTNIESSLFNDIQVRLREVVQPLINYKNIKLEMRDPSVPFLHTTNPDQLNLFFVLINSYSYGCGQNLERLNKLKLKAITLIEYFKNKYHLK